jgi:hypothetical protein
MKTSSSESDLVARTSAEKRSGLARRQPVPFPPQFSSFRRRHSRGRRETDFGGYVDIYDRRSWAIALAILGLSCADAVLTVLQIEKGIVQEANPLMNVVLAWGGAYAFFSLKAAMTAFALAIIILHKEWVLARHMARLCLFCYILILIYHMYLVSNHRGLLAFL